MRKLLIISLVAAASLIAPRLAAAQCYGGACQLRAYTSRQARAYTPAARTYRATSCAAYRANYGACAASYQYAATVGYWTSGQCYGVAACSPVESSPRPCAPTTTAPRYYSQIVENACAPVSETPAPCESVETVTAPEACAPVETTTPTPCESCGEYTPVKTQNGALVYKSCPTGACPLQAATKAAARTVSRLLDAVNATRARYGLAALSLDSNLQGGSQFQASFCASRGALIHGSGVAEILAQNSQGIETALSQWLNSPAHRALLLSPTFTRAGVAVHVDGSGRVWCAARFR
ncbi:hypothetical protein IJ103_00050 [Candidatus Saccharibacteria bacterium]|nr:hypothetical protein [Candidatus Saccharibacteria bacterium]